MGSNKDALDTARCTANKLATHLSHKKISAAGARLLHTLVIQAKIKYSMVLSNASTEQINALQTSTKQMLCRKHGLRKNAPNAAIYGEYESLGWNRWGDTCQIERLKILVQGLSTKGNVGAVMKGAIARLQLYHGSGAPVLESTDTDKMNHSAASTQWLYQLWKWNASNGVTVKTDVAIQNTGHRVGDFRLMDRARNANERKAIARHLPRCTWASDVLLDGKRSTTLSPPGQANEDPGWQEAAKRMCVSIHGKMTRLGEWITNKTAKEAELAHVAKIGWYMKEDTLHRVSTDGRTATIYSPHTYTVGSRTRTTWLPTTNETPADWHNAVLCDTSWHKGRKRPEPLEKWEEGHNWPCDMCSDNYSKKKRWEIVEQEGTFTDTPTNDNTCYGCNRVLCEKHAKEATSKRHMGQWICIHCRAQHTASTRKPELADASGYLIRNEREVPTFSESQDPETVLTEPTASEPETQALEGATGRQTLEIHSDGSHRREEQVGTYAWEVGWHDENGYWTQLAKGGGKCAQEDNPHVPITSTRMEAIGLLRGIQRIHRSRWTGSIVATLDNESTSKRFVRHRDERHKKQWRKPDWDVWEAMRRVDTSRTKVKWVQGHPEKRKKPAQYTQEEKRNVAMDAEAERHYEDTNTDKPWTTDRGPVAIDGFPLTAGIKGALERNARTRVSLDFFDRKCNKGTGGQTIDRHVMKEIQRAETRAGLLTKSLRITHALWATNEYLSSAGKRESHKCPLCGKDGETSGHLKSHCPEETVTAIRNKMTSDIAALVQTELGESMPDVAWQAVADMWSQKTLREANPDDATVKTSGVTCMNCKKGHKCKWKGKKGHLLPGTTAAHEPEAHSEEYEGLDEHVKKYLDDMTKPGARTTWMGWFPRSFTNMLTSFQIPTKKAHELALSIRNTITNGMDDIWRERNAAQHTPKERQEINPRVLEAFEKKTRLGLDQGPHTKAEDITKLPHRMKKKWLENAQKRIDEKEEDDKRRMAAVKAITTGGKWKWNPAANAEERKITKKKIEKPTRITPWEAMEGDTEQPNQRSRKTVRAKNTTKRSKGVNDGMPAVHSPWDLSPMAAPAGSIASAGPAPPVANGATGAAAAAAATAHTGATSAQIKIATSTDLPRRERDGAHGRQKRSHTPPTHTRTAHERPSNSEENVSLPFTPGLDDDPDRIDDVV